MHGDVNDDVVAHIRLQSRIARESLEAAERDVTVAEHNLTVAQQRLAMVRTYAERVIERSAPYDE